MNYYKNKDLNYGLPKENEMLKYFNEYLNADLKLSDNKYSAFDYIDNDNKIIVELKSRRVKKEKYYDVLVNKSKIDYGFDMIKKGYTVYIAWAFIDQLCIYKLSKKSFSKKWIQLNYLGRYDRGSFEYNDVVLIPVKKMSCVTNL
jgi:hypothetical protein